MSIRGELIYLTAGACLFVLQRLVQFVRRGLVAPYLQSLISGRS